MTDELMIEACAGGLNLFGVPKEIGRQVVRKNMEAAAKLEKQRESLTLKEAIESLALHAASTHRLRDWEPELRLVLDAARAFACTECGGLGVVHPNGTGTVHECESCKAARQNVGARK